MNEFKKYRLLEQHRDFDNVLNETVSTYAPVLQEAVEQWAESIDRWERYVIAEKLSPDEVSKIFTALSKVRGDDDAGLKSKGKDAASGLADKARQLAGATKEQAAKVKKLLSDISKKAANELPSEVRQKLEAGGNSAKDAIAFIDNKVDDLIVGAESDLRQKGPAGEQAVDAIRKIGNAARKYPKSAGFALAAITAITTMATGGMAGPAVGLLARGTLEMMKGEKLSTAVGKGLKTAAIGGAIGAGADMIGDVAGDVFADIQYEEPELDFTDVPGTDLTNLNMTGSVNGYQYDHNILANEEDLAKIEEMSNQLDQLESFSSEWYQAQIEYLNHLADIESSPEQEARWQQYEQGAQQSDQLRAQYEKDVANYNANTAEAREVAQRVAQAAGAAGAGVAGAKAERTRESTEINRMRELAGLPPLNEGPKWDAIKKGARGAKDMAQGASQKWKGKKAISAEELEAQWKEAGSPVDEKAFQKFLKNIGITDKEIRTAMSAVPGANVELDTKTQQRVEKIVALIQRLDIADEIKTHIATTGIEAKESLIYEEIDFPEHQLDDETIVSIFQSLEKVLPQLKQQPAQEPEQSKDKPESEKPASNDYSPKDSANVSPSSASINGQTVQQNEAIRIINKLVEHMMLGRMRR